MWKIVVLFLSTLGTSEAAFKRWLPNTDFGNARNWKSGRLPCGNDIVVIQEESPSIFLQLNTTIAELRLPKNGEIVLGSDSTLAFTNNADHSAGCLSSGSQVEYNATYPSDWLDPKNWCSSDTETGPCITTPRLDSEMVPCKYDDVVFQKGHSYYVNLDTGFDLTVNTLKITGNSFTTNTFSSYLNTNAGKLMFPIPHTGSRSTIKIQRRPCNDPTGCACGNDDDKILKHICNIQSPHCKLAKCSSSLQPKGSCCKICGGILTVAYASGFRLNMLHDGLKRNFLDNKDEYKDVVFIVSKTSDGKIQMVLSDDKGTKSSEVAKLMKKELDDDISSGGFRYGVTEATLETSEDVTKPLKPGAQTVEGSINTLSVDLDTRTTTQCFYTTVGAQQSLPGGEIAGIVIGLALVLLVVLLIAFFVYRRKTRSPDELGFKIFDKISFRNKKKPRVEVPPSFGFSFGGPSPENIGTQGFDNPMYGTNPLEEWRELTLIYVEQLNNTGTQNEKPLDLELMPTEFVDPQEQPTFNNELGFDNPLYDSVVQESFFSDPTSADSKTDVVKPHSKVEKTDSNA